LDQIMAADAAHERKIGIDLTRDLSLSDRHCNADDRNPLIHRFDVFLPHTAFRNAPNDDRIGVAREAVIELGQLLIPILVASGLIERHVYTGPARLLGYAIVNSQPKAVF